MKISHLGEVIKFNDNFKTAINLYLSLNKTEKVLNYIPTKSSVLILDDYLTAALNNKENANLLIGPYGKGKSHLLLVLLAILSLERNKENTKVIKNIADKIEKLEGIGEKVKEDINSAWENKRYLPVIVSDTSNGLSQAFLTALNDALKREDLNELAPDTYYSDAIKKIEDWKENYPNTYEQFEQLLRSHETSIKVLRKELKTYSEKALSLFKELYPKVTAGSTFNPLASSDVLPLYKGVSEKLAEEYDYKGIYIVFDEFSKFIESLDGHNAGASMKLIQDMCELASESGSSQIRFTMVAHKSIKEYGKHLSNEIINAFTGIEGRIVEKYFITSSKNNYELIKNAIVKDVKFSEVPQIKKYLSQDKADKYYELPTFKSSFERKDFEEIVFKGCYPLNPISSYLLLNTSEKVGQNERTLFTFISNDEPNSMSRLVCENEIDRLNSIGADAIYDYFSGIFKKDINNEAVHNIWLSAEYALTKCATEEEKKIVKAIAIMLIVNKNDDIPTNEKFICLSVFNEISNESINKLVEKHIIYLKSSTETYSFQTRAGSELKAEINKQRTIKADNKVNYPAVLQQITGRHFVIPRKYNSDNRITRYFIHEYMDVSTFLSIDSAETFFDKKTCCDGKVITLYSFGSPRQREVSAHVEKLACTNLVVVSPKDKLDELKTLKDFEILEEIRQRDTFINNNGALKREIPLLEEEIVAQVEASLAEIYESDRTAIYSYQSNCLKKDKWDQAENVVGQCCNELYFKAPIINNELINRSEITTAQTKKTRICVINALLNHTDDENYLSGSGQEATVYRALFVNTGLNSENPQKNLAEVISLIDSYIDSCCDHKNSLEGIVEKITSKPYGMRKGVVPFFFAYALSKRREDIILYFSGMETQLDAERIVNMCEKPAAYSLFISKEDHLKEKYIKSLNAMFYVNEERGLSDNRIKNIIVCMQRWFRGLPQISRNITGIDAYNCSEETKHNLKIIKKTLQKAESNPYEILFVNFPKEFKAKKLSDVYEILKECKQILDTYYDWSTNRVATIIGKVFGNTDENRDLLHLLKEWHDNQSEQSKKGLHSNSIISLMTCIEKLDVNKDNDNHAVAQKLAFAVSNMYLENWFENAFDEFETTLTNLKEEIQEIKSENSNDKLNLSFTGTDGQKKDIYFEKPDEDEVMILKNMLEDALETYDDLSVNDRVAVLVEMIEKITR